MFVYTQSINLRLQGAKTPSQAICQIRSITLGNVETKFIFGSVVKFCPNRISPPSMSD